MVVAARGSLRIKYARVGTHDLANRSSLRVENDF